MKGMFIDCLGLTELKFGNIDTSNVTDMSAMFADTKLQNIDISSWNTANVTDMSGMFMGCDAETISLNGINTSKVQYMSDLFQQCYNLKSINISDLDVSSVTSMEGMFYGCNQLSEIDISGFEISDDTDISFMFSDCSSLRTIYTIGGADWSNKATGYYPFLNCYYLEGDICYDSNKTGIEYAKVDKGYFTEKFLTRIKLYPKTSTVYVGYAIQMTVKLPVGYYESDLEWETENEKIATVSAGVVTGIGEGVVKITVKSKDGIHSASSIITVKKYNIDPSDDDNEGGEEGDLPPGKAIPNGIWVGGLKKSYPYTGNAIKPSFRVYYGNKRLSLGTDYTLSFKNNTNIGTNAQITVKLKGNFSGSESLKFEITKNNIATSGVTAESLVVAYKTGKKNNNVKPVLTLNGRKLKNQNSDFEYLYLKDSSSEISDCSQVGNYIIRVSSKNTSAKYTGFIDVPLTVTDKPMMKDVKITYNKKNLNYYGGYLIPIFTLKYKGKQLPAGSYEMKTDANDNYIEPGDHAVVFVGNGTDVIGSQKVNFKIKGKRNLGDAYTTASIKTSELDNTGKVPYAYGGSKPAVVVKYKNDVLKAGRDYTLSYKNNKKAGSKATVTIKGKGKYKNSKKVNFTVSQKNLGDLILTVGDRVESSKMDDYKKTSILLTNNNFVDQKLKYGRDYTTVFYVSSSNSTPKAGDMVNVSLIAIEGGNYTGSISGSYRIISKSSDFSKAKVTVNGGKGYGYTGKAIQPIKSEIKVTIGNISLGDDDYEIVSYYNNINRGNNAVILLRGKGKYSGIKVSKYKIESSSVKNPKIWDGVMAVKRLFAVKEKRLRGDWIFV